MRLLNKLTACLEKVYERPLLFLSFIYCLAFSTLLVNNGIFWDDWHVHFFTNQQAFEFYFGVSRPFHAWLFTGLRAITPSHYFVNFLTFICSWITGVFFYLTLKKIGSFSKKEVFWISTLFMIFPQCFSRMCETILFFVIYLSFFTTASYFFIFSPRNSRYVRALCFFALFFSLGLEALMLFILIPLSLRYYLANNSKFPLRLRNIWQFCKEEWLFLGLPFFYLLLRKTIVFAAPAEMTENMMSLQRLQGVPSLIWSSWSEGFVRAVISLFKRYQLWILGIVTLSIVVAPKFQMAALQRNIKGIVFSLIFFVVSILPYVLVGKDIGYYYIMDRNSLLAIFAFSFLVYYLMALLTSFSKIESLRSVLLLFVLCLFIQRNFIVYRSFLITSLKQDALVYYIANIPEFKTGTTFLIKDETYDYWAKETPLESSVARGLVRSVFNTTDKCIAHLPDECPLVGDNERTSILHNIWDYKPTKNQYEVKINYGPISLNGNDVFRWIYYKIVRPSFYNENIKDFIQVRLTQL